MAFVTDKAAYDRRAIMREAHRLRHSALVPAAFGDALRFAWQRARETRELRLATWDRLERRSRPSLSDRAVPV